MKHIIEGKGDLQGTAPALAARQVEVDEESAGQRLDNFLIRQLKGVPKTHVYRIIRSGEVRLNKGRASADSRVQPGDIVRLPPVRVAERSLEGAQAPVPARERVIPPRVRRCRWRPWGCGRARRSQRSAGPAATRVLSV